MVLSYFLYTLGKRKEDTLQESLQMVTGSGFLMHPAPVEIHDHA
jgi:hypothetical protein